MEEYWFCNIKVIFLFNRWLSLFVLWRKLLDIWFFLWRKNEKSVFFRWVIIVKKIFLLWVNLCYFEVVFFIFFFFKLGFFMYRNCCYNLKIEKCVFWLIEGIVCNLYCSWVEKLIKWVVFMDVMFVNIFIYCVFNI